MRRTEVLEVLRRMKFEDVYRRWQGRALSQAEAAQILGMSERTFDDGLRDVVGLYLNPPDKALVLCVTHYNRTCQPFVWTASADSILTKLHRLCSRINGTEHQAPGDACEHSHERRLMPLASRDGKTLPMRVVFHCPWGNARNWLQILREAGPEISFETAEAIDDPGAIRAAVVWSPPPGFFDVYPKLEVIAVLGAGADYLFVPGMRLPAVPIARIVDPLMAERIAGWVLATTLHFHRHLDRYLEQQRERRWLRHEHPDFAEVGVGVMGLGTMGSAAAGLLARVGYDVAGWSRSAKTVGGIRSFSGEEDLVAFLNRSDVLVCLLPLTPETRGILGARTFAALPDGAVVLNAGRGAHLVEPDLVHALDRGKLRAAALDVFAEEPLREDHPLWRHPKILVTPHVASLTNPRTGAEQIIEALRTVRAGGTPKNLIDPERGY